MRKEYIWHGNGKSEQFLTEYFPSKNILFIGSIGFDPRTLMTFQTLKAITNKIHPIFFEEDRENVSSELKSRAKQTAVELGKLLGQSPTTFTIPIFAADGAPIGGVELIKAAEKNIKGIASYTDVVIDICAMSRGIFFPLVRYIRDMIQRDKLETSLHVLVVDHPSVDYSYKPQYDDTASWMKGFDANAGLKGNPVASKLWLPQLMSGRSGMYETLFNFIQPNDVCPVLPFPGVKPKRVDELVIEYRDEIDKWDTSLQNIVLASESDPLDLYDTVIRVHKARQKICDPHITVLSPMGSKVSTIGGLLAAMDEELPVAYVETLGYHEDANSSTPDVPDIKNLVHVWVDGPIYPPCE
ncbi:MAG TPA: hypothetical protein VIE65_10060 [Methylobacter sp.]|jgi:hypothetical protein